MKNCMKRTLCVIVSLVIVSLTVIGIYAEDYYMAYNFYSNPVLSGTSRKFDTFMIDFRGIDTPKATYWSLCNFEMDLTSPETRAAYPEIRGYGAYCGLQNTESSKGRTGILSFWEANYKSEGAVWTQLDDGTYAYAVNGKKSLVTASRVYPGGSSTFGGEGEGTNIIESYPWEDGKWYTCMLHSWTDAETGTTFVGIWFRNNSTREWTLFSYFDTHLYNSYLRGAMSQFQENYSATSVYNYKYVRTCNLKNMYVHDLASSDWVSLSSSTLSYGDGGGKNKAGAHSFGVDADGEFWWGSTGGIVENQEAYEASSQKSGTFTIDQPDLPALEAASAVVPRITVNSSGKQVRWSLPTTSAPQLGYTLNIYDYYGNLLFSKHETRPEVRSVDISSIKDPAIRCELSIDYVFGIESQNGSASSEAYDNPCSVSVLPARQNGEYLEIPVAISGNPGFEGFDLDIAYDADAVEFVSGELTVAGTGTVTSGEGVVHLSLQDADCSDDTEIAALRFKTIGHGYVSFTPRVSYDKCFYVMNEGAKIRIPTVGRSSSEAVGYDEEHDFCYQLTASPLTVTSERVTVTVEMKNTPADIYGFSIEVSFDPEKLAFNEGVFYEKFPYARAVCNTEGVVRAFAATEIHAPVNTDEKMLDLIFDIIDPDISVGSRYPFEISFYNGQPAYTRTADKRTVNITDVFPFGTEAVVEAFDRYDLDRSGDVSIGDVSCLLDFLSTNCDYDAFFDLDGSGAVNIDDVSDLLDVLAVSDS